MNISNAILGLMFLVGSFVVPSSVSAVVISGNISNWREAWGFQTIGDGDHQVSLYWSVRGADQGWFYGSRFNRSSDVALLTNISDITQIGDASLFNYSSTSVGPACDADCSASGVGDFLVWRNVRDGFYGVLRIDDIFVLDPDNPKFTFNTALNGTWWFQTDGTGNFSVVPLPSSIWLFGSGLVALFLVRRAVSV